MGELLMTNKTASALFHRDLAGIKAVLADAALSQKHTLLARDHEACSHTAGGLKLKLVERDIVFGRKGNVLDVVDALGALGYNVIVLQRSNHLDNLLGRMSRRRTGVLHCKQRDGTGASASFNKGRCDPARLNMSVTLSCSKARASIDRLRLRKRAKDLMFRQWPDAADGSGRVLRIEYEALVRSPSTWVSLMRLLGLPGATDACLLRDRFQKRVTQTQRELIRNFEGLSSCLQRSGAIYAGLLHGDFRPASGRLPRDTRALCGRASIKYDELPRNEPPSAARRVKYLPPAPAPGADAPRWHHVHSPDESVLSRMWKAFG